jgi:type IV secretion system protein VirD4
MDPALLLGYETGQPRGPIGFTSRAAPEAQAGKPILFRGDGPLLTIAPTGAGKGIGVIVPNLLTWPGPAIVIDPKGENCAITAGRRRAMGQTVLRLDPFAMLDAIEGGSGGGLNPLDLLDMGSPHVVDDAAALAEAIVPDGQLADPHWEVRGRQVLTGFLLFAAAYGAADQRHLGLVRKIVVQDTDGLGLVLAAMRASPLCDGRIRDGANIVLGMPDRERGSVLSTVSRAVDPFGTSAVVASLARSTVPLEAIRDGAPLTIFMVLPPDKLASHAALLRLWLTIVIAMVIRRRVAPALPTLLLVDEAAQLGPLPLLRTAIVLLRASGLQTWTVWQDPSLLRRLYPADWECFLSNAHAVQAFGFRTRRFADEIADLTGYDGLLHGLPDDIAVIAEAGRAARLCRRPDYRRDARFAGLWRPNPMFAMRNRDGVAQARDGIAHAL